MSSAKWVSTYQSALFAGFIRASRKRRDYAELLWGSFDRCCAADNNPAAWLAHHLVKPFVVGRALEWRKLGAKRLGVPGAGMSLARLMVGPRLDQLEMIGVLGPDQRVEAPLSLVFAAVLGELLDQRRDLVLAGREHIDMGDDVHREIELGVGRRRGDRQRRIGACAERRDDQGLKFLAECLHRRTVRVER